ncbi:Flagellar motor switch protein FliM [Phycisphaerae bacterium RAS1]|nr:Flagellar motor switch protein FliM [Phycisphaerae bacterium RAS1]
MAEVLDQSEVDALLSAVGGGDAEQPAVSGRPIPKPPEYKVYDFQRPERVSKDHIRALSSIHDGFARNFGATLSGFLRTIIDVRVVGVEQLTYGELIHSLPNPTCLMVLQAPPLEGQMCLEISPLIVYPILDRLLGGASGATAVPQRPLTTIEWRLVARIVERAMLHLSEAWRNLVDTQFAVVEQESNPHLVHIVAPGEVVVFITFDIKLGQAAGTMSLCVPFNTIESVLSKLATQSWFGYRPKAVADPRQERIHRNLMRTTVGISAFLGRTRIRLCDLRSLRPGDLIQLDRRTDAPMLVQIEQRTKFAGLPGQLRGRRAIRLVRPAAIDEPL